MGIGSDLADDAWVIHGGLMSEEEESKKSTRVFYAHPASYSVEDIVEDKTTISEILKASDIITGREGFSENYMGNWSDWCNHVVDRIHPLDGKPRFNFFITPEQELGKATADILDRALGERRAVYYFNKKEGRLEQVKSIQEIDRFNYVAGWKVQL